MKKYGLKIGDVGVEFSSVEERTKALTDFTKGVDVKISSTGIRYTDGEGTFSVYERDTKEILVTCIKCQGVFGIDVCGDREYPTKDYTWEKEYSSKNGYICDACLARQVKARDLFEAQKLVNQAKGE